MTKEEVEAELKATLGGYREPWKTAAEELCRSWLLMESRLSVLEEALDTIQMHTLSEKDDHGDFALVNRGEMEQAIERVHALDSKEAK